MQAIDVAASQAGSSRARKSHLDEDSAAVAAARPVAEASRREQTPAQPAAALAGRVEQVARREEARRRCRRTAQAILRLANEEIDCCQR